MLDVAVAFKKIIAMRLETFFLDGKTTRIGEVTIARNCLARSFAAAFVGK